MSLRLLVASAVGMSLPALAYGVFYARIGALPALVTDTVRGLPQRIAWFVPFEPLPGRTVSLGVAIGSSFAMLVAWRRRSLPLALAALSLAVAAVLPATRGRLGSGTYSTDDLLPLLPWLPVSVLAAAMVTLVGEPADASAADGRPSRGVLALLVFFAAATLLQLYPAADIPHGAMILPAFLPLLAHALGRVVRRAGPAALVLAACWLLGTAWPFVRPRLHPPPPGPPAFARASLASRSRATSSSVMFCTTTARLRKRHARAKSGIPNTDPYKLMLKITVTRMEIPKMRALCLNIPGSKIGSLPLRSRRKA